MISNFYQIFNKLPIYHNYTCINEIVLKLSYLHQSYSCSCSRNSAIFLCTLSSHMSAYVFSQAYYQDSNPNQHYIKKEDARD